MRVIRIFCEGQQELTLVEEVVRKLMINQLTKTEIRLQAVGGKTQLFKRFQELNHDANLLFLFSADTWKTLLESAKSNSNHKNMIIGSPSLAEDWLGLSADSLRNMTNHEFWSAVNKALAGEGFAIRKAKSKSMGEFISYLT